MTHTDIISDFQPILLDISNIELLTSAISRTDLLVYGEIHGIQENAHVIYTLVHCLGIKRLAVESAPSVKPFIDAAAAGKYDFSLIDTDVFHLSILSIEVAKAIATLVREGTVQEVVYIDTYAEAAHHPPEDHPDSPQKREQCLADNLLALDGSRRTLGLMGQWHTQPSSIPLTDKAAGPADMHLSALYRLRTVRPHTPLVQNVYRKGRLFNDRRVITLPERPSLPDTYQVAKVSDIDYDLYVPIAHKTELPAVQGGYHAV